MSENKAVQKRLVSFLKKRDPALPDKEIADILNSLKRFVNLTKKIYTEPQAQVSFRDKKVGNKIQKDRIFTTDVQELVKVMDKHIEPLEKVMRKFHKSVTKKKHE